MPKARNQNKMLMMRRHMRFSSYHSRGLAISLILLAVVLLAAIGVALAFGSRSDINGTSTQKAKVLAATLLNQAAALKNGMNLEHDLDSVYTQYMTVDTASQTGIYNPSTGFIEKQTPPTDAYVTAVNAAWVWKFNSSTYSPTVTLNNVGTSSPDYLFATVNLIKSVCQQINNSLLGTTSIPVETVGTATAWSTSATTMNLSSEAAVNGIPAQCVQTTDGQYVFYTVVRPA